MKQTFPTWAPRSLVEKYQSKLKYSESLDKSEIINNPLAAPAELLEIHRRILTDSDCKKAFDILTKASCRYDADSLCFGLGHAIDRAYYACANAYKTQGQMRKTFGKAAKKTAALIDEINADRALMQLADDTVCTYLEYELQKERANDGEDPQTFTGHDVAFMFIDSILSGPDLEKSFDDSSVAYQASRVVDIARNARLTDILAVLQTHLAELETTYTAIVKQPKRNGCELRAALIGFLHGFFKGVTGKPHDDAVAALVTVGLDLDPPLTRDDVRPYTGKKKL